jgi:hypothetical protein
MKKFYQYMEQIRNIVLYENINEVKNKSIREQIKKLINKYKYNKSIHVFKKYTANKQDFENIILNNQKKYWSESGRKDSIRICFLIEYEQNYEFYTFSTDIPYPNNQNGSDDNYQMKEGFISAYTINKDGYEEIKLNEYAKTLWWIFSNKIR